MKGNGHDSAVDEGLIAIRESFKGAKYSNTDAFDAAGLIQLGAHRSQNIPDAIIMEVYGTITEGSNCQLKFESDAGAGYVANIETYADLVSFMQGSLEVSALEAG